MAMSFEFDPNELIELLQANPCTEAYSEWDWKKVGIGIYEAGLSLEVWDAWSSAVDPRYKKEECAEAWRRFGMNAGKGYTYKIAYETLKKNGVDISRTPNNTAKRKNPRALERDRAKTDHQKKEVSWGNISPDKFKRVSRKNAAPQSAFDTPRSKLVKAANDNLKNNKAAQDRVRAYLAAHIGITPEVAAERYGLGFLTREIIDKDQDLASFASQYGRGDWLIMPAAGKRDYFVARAIPSGDYKRWAGWKDEYKNSPNGCKAKNPKGNKPALTNPEALNGEPVFVVEGIQDEAALRERGFNATATLGIDYKRATVKALEGYEGGVIVMFDSDEAGREACKKLAADLNGACLVFDWGDVPYKDAGEWNGADPGGLTKALDHAAAQMATRIETGKKSLNLYTEQSRPENKRRNQAGYFFKKKTNVALLYEWLECNLESGTIALNRASGDISITKRLPWDEPTADAPRDFHWKLDYSAFTRAIEADFYNPVAKEKLDLALTEFGKLQSFDPVIEAIEGLPTVEYNADGSTTFTERDGKTWTQEPLYTEDDLKTLGEVEPDGFGGFYIRFNGDDTTGGKIFHLPRVAGFVLWHVLKADLTPLTFYSECIHLCGVIGRGLHHGCNYQFMLALQGNQGIGKDAYIASTAIDPDRLLSSGDTSKAIRAPEEEAVKSAGKLVHNFHEFSAARRKDGVNAFKEYVSTNSEVINVKFRPRFEQKRSFVLASSSNDFDLINDRTGARRFLIVRCNATLELDDTFGWRYLNRLVRASLAEVYHEYHQKEEWSEFQERLALPSWLKRARNAQADLFTVEDPIAEQITGWLAEYHSSRNNAAKKSLYRICIEQAAIESGAFSAEEWQRVRRVEARNVQSAINSYRINGKQVYQFMGSKRAHGTIRHYETGVPYKNPHYWELRSEFRPDGSEDDSDQN